MSNHSGSHMLNSMLARLEREAFFSDIGPEKTEEFFRHIYALSWDYDCNPGEILDGIGERLAICDTCFTLSKGLVDGTCASCRRDFAS